MEPARILGYWLCHQDPHRSVDLGGTVLPICARCTPLYLFLGIALWSGLLAGKPRGRHWPIAPGSAALAGCAVILAQWGGARLGLWESTTVARFLTGMLAGSGIGWLIHSATASRLWTDAARPAWIPVAAFAVAGSAAAAVLLIEPGWPAAAVVVGWASILGFLTASAWMAATILSYVVVDRDRRPRLVPVIAVTSAIVAGEIAFLALVRI